MARMHITKKLAKFVSILVLAYLLGAIAAVVDLYIINRV
jgi:hypothetical protein